MKQENVPFAAPDFDLDGVKLSDFKGKWVVLYFYPKDNTPGCSTEACSLRDARDELTDLGAEVIGVSADSAESHEKFKQKFNLNFKLIADTNKEIIQKYGAWGKKQFGREGILRKTFLIDPDGMVQKVYGRVTPLGHGQKVIDDLKSLIGK